MSGIQTDLFAPTLAQQFAAWKETPGGRLILFHAYKLAAAQADKFVRYGQRGSVRLLWEQLRYRFNWVRACAARKRVTLEKWGGYALNDHFHAYVARHIMARRPDWAGMFELRETGKVRKKRKVIVIEEALPQQRPTRMAA